MARIRSKVEPSICSCWAAMSAATREASASAVSVCMRLAFQLEKPSRISAGRAASVTRRMRRPRIERSQTMAAILEHIPVRYDRNVLQPSGETSRAQRAPGSGARSAAKSAEPRSWQGVRREARIFTRSDGTAERFHLSGICARKGEDRAPARSSLLLLAEPDLVDLDQPPAHELGRGIDAGDEARHLLAGLHIAAFHALLLAIGAKARVGEGREHGGFERREPVGRHAWRRLIGTA